MAREILRKPHSCRPRSAGLGRYASTDSAQTSVSSTIWCLSFCSLGKPLFVTTTSTTGIAAHLQKNRVWLATSLRPGRWSVADGKWLKMDETVMLQQLEDVLDHATESPNEAVPILIGHSTGGTLAILAARSTSFDRRKIRRLVLVSPALWANKPLIARVADRAYNCMFSMLRCGFPGLSGAIRDAYIQNCDAAFAREPGTKAHRYETQYQKALVFNRKMLADHPYIIGGIAGITSYFLRADLFPRWRDALAEVATRKQADGSALQTVCLIFGEEDVVVDYRSPLLTDLKKHAMITVSPLAKLGHESLYEDSAAVGRAALAFLGSDRC